MISSWSIKFFFCQFVYTHLVRQKIKEIEDIRYKYYIYQDVSDFCLIWNSMKTICRETVKQALYYLCLFIYQVLLILFPYPSHSWIDRAPRRNQGAYFCYVIGDVNQRECSNSNNYMKYETRHRYFACCPSTSN